MLYLCTMGYGSMIRYALMDEKSYLRSLFLLTTGTSMMVQPMGMQRLQHQA